MAMSFNNYYCLLTSSLSAETCNMTLAHCCDRPTSRSTFGMQTAGALCNTVAKMKKYVQRARHLCDCVLPVAQLRVESLFENNAQYQESRVKSDKYHQWPQGELRAHSILKKGILNALKLGPIYHILSSFDAVLVSSTDHQLYVIQ